MPQPVRVLLALAPLAIAAAAEGPLVSASRTRALPLVVADLAAVESARLYVTADNGATWTLAEELTIAPGTTQAPRFSYTAPQDGVYGFASAVTFRNKQREPEPRAGQAPQVAIRFDATPPRIERFAATATARTGGTATLKAEWTIVDDAPAAEAGQLEVAVEGGAFTPVARGGATAALGASVAVPTGATAIQVRLRATDAAGNVMEGQPVAVALPAPAAPAAPDEGLAKAIAALPVIPAAPAPAAEPTPAPAPATAEPAPTLVPAPAPVIATRPDVVVPPRAADAARPAAEEPVVRGGGLEGEFRRAQQPTAPTEAWQERGRQRPGTPAAAPPAPAEPPPAAKPTAKGAEGAPAAAPVPRSPLPEGVPPAGMLSPQQAEAVIAAARAAAGRGQLDDAATLFRRLRSSPQAEAAVLEELRMWRAQNRVADGVAAAAALPESLRSDPVRIEHGRLLLAAGRADEARQAVAPIARTSAQARAALLLMGDSLAAEGKRDQATKVWQHLASGSDDVAATARGRLPAQPAPKPAAPRR